MKKSNNFRLASFHWVLVATIGISIGISLAHFLIPHYYLVIHGFLRRIYYIPVILTGLLCGTRKTIYLVGLISMVYLPLVLFQWDNHQLPANLEELYEILILGCVGGITGILSDRERKIGIPDHILLTDRKLTDEDLAIIKTHPEIGYKILKDSQSPLLKMSAEIALSHHEKFDGSGYPNGLRANGIPLAARIVAVADVFDALTTSRPYKKLCQQPIK
jgi:hypothetical protein